MQPSASAERDGGGAHALEPQAQPSEPQAQPGGGEPGEPVAYDPNTSDRHSYLGELDELEGAFGLLAPGAVGRLPLLLLEGVVLFPGAQLPLLLRGAHERALLRCLSAAYPLTRLIAVLPGPRSLLRTLPRVVCCTAEVRQMRAQSGGDSVALLAVGRQRALVLDEPGALGEQGSVLLRVLGEGCEAGVPREVRAGLAAIHPLLAKPWDLRALAARLVSRVRLVLPPVAAFVGSPLELSYRVSSNLPLQPSARQLLLTADGPAERLRLLLALLERLDSICCSACSMLLASLADVLATTSEGVGGTFVNAHGYVHELVTLSRMAARLQLHGAPETAHSYFPGFAWTMAFCRCGQHLGWRFSAARPHLQPREFWGLRRAALAAAQSSSDGGSGNGGSRDGSREGSSAREPGSWHWLPRVIRLGDQQAQAQAVHGAAAGAQELLWEESELDEDEEG